MQDEIMKLFLEKKYSPYSIHVKTGIGIKKIYHHIKQYEDQVRAKKKKEIYA